MATKIDPKTTKVNYLFVSAGEETKMYTLCMNYQRVDGNGVVVENGTGYIKNLSTNYQTAVDKAIKFASEIGATYRLALDEFDLNPIVRGEAAPRKLTREEKKAIKEQEQRELVERQYDVMMVSGLMQIGKHTGLTAREVYARDPNYISYAASKKDHDDVQAFSKFAVNVALCKEFVMDNPSLFKNFGVVEDKVVKLEDPLIGEVDDVLTDVEFKVLSAEWVDGYAYNSKVYRIIGVTERGEYVMLKTVMKKLVDKTTGNKVTIKECVVKTHTYTRDHKVTVIGGRMKL